MHRWPPRRVYLHSTWPPSDRTIKSAKASVLCAIPLARYGGRTRRWERAGSGSVQWYTSDLVSVSRTHTVRQRLRGPHGHMLLGVQLCSFQDQHHCQCQLQRAQFPCSARRPNEEHRAAAHRVHEVEDDRRVTAKDLCNLQEVLMVRDDPYAQVRGREQLHFVMLVTWPSVNAGCRKMGRGVVTDIAGLKFSSSLEDTTMECARSRQVMST